MAVVARPPEILLCPITGVELAGRFRALDGSRHRDHECGFAHQ